MTSRVIDTVPAQIVDEDHVRIGGSEFARVHECTMRTIAPPKILEGWLDCPNCGPCYPPTADAIQKAVKYCPFCGAEVID